MKIIKTAKYKKIAQLGPYVKPKDIQPNSVQNNQSQNNAQETVKPDPNSFFDEVSQKERLPGQGDGYRVHLVVDAQNPEAASVEYDNDEEPYVDLYDSTFPNKSRRSDETYINVENLNISTGNSEVTIFLIAPSVMETIRQNISQGENIGSLELMKQLFITGKGDERGDMFKKDMISKLPSIKAPVGKYGDANTENIKVPGNFSWWNGFMVIYYNY